MSERKEFEQMKRKQIEAVFLKHDVVLIRGNLNLHYPVSKEWNSLIDDLLSLPNSYQGWCLHITWGYLGKPHTMGSYYVDSGKLMGVMVPDDWTRCPVCHVFRPIEK